MADQTGMKTLHMFTAGDPTRNASFVFFADPNYFITDFPATTCETCINPLFAWNHGDIQREIATTWLGFVGPGVRNQGQDGKTWSDHTDVRPTVLSLVGLQDTYIHDGRVLTETIDDHAVPKRLRDHKNTLSEFAHIYKQINAPFGRLALASLKISTAALASGDESDDSAYTALQNKITAFTGQRDAIAVQMRAMLDGAAFKHETFDEVTARQLINHAEALLEEVGKCAANIPNCAK
jgi:hypothetical protein